MPSGSAAGAQTRTTFDKCDHPNSVCVQAANPTHSENGGTTRRLYATLESHLSPADHQLTLPPPFPLCKAVGLIMGFMLGTEILSESHFYTYIEIKTPAKPVMLYIL